MKTKSKKLFAIAAVIALVTLLSVCLTACNNPQPGYTALSAQADIVTELNAKTADAGILDQTMAKYILSTGSAMANKLTIVKNIKFPAEEYGIAFRKGSTGLSDRVNKALYDLKSTKVAEIAAKYGLTNSVLSLDYTAPTTPVDDTDWNRIVAKGEIVIGYTLNPPMAFKDNDNNLKGFDIELPKAVFAQINETCATNLTVKFQLIDWDNMLTEIQSAVDCIWNGMTINDVRKENMQISNPYLVNQQVVIIRKDDVKKYTTLASLKNARIVAEKGSAGEDVAKTIFPG